MSSARGIVVVGLLLTFPASAFSQPADPVLQTPWGDPDLQGMWPGGSVVMVPFERSQELVTRAVFTEQEHAAHEQMMAALVQRLVARGGGLVRRSLARSDDHRGRPPWWWTPRAGGFP